ncbi:radical SAM protein [Acidobacteriota bacterium]
MYVYGPVPSRRLGRSLGVSPIVSKTCSYSCVYCQLGRTRNPKTQRTSAFAKEDILSQIVGLSEVTKPDYITFCGDGEPTLCKDLGWLIQETKAILPIPVAVITNGSLMYRKDVRQDLCRADVVIPSLDAGDEKTFWKINRPHPSLDYTRIVQGLVDFRREFKGQLWLEIMLVRDLNDREEPFGNIKDLLKKINPDRVYLLTPIRPPAESWVKSPEPSRILEIMNEIEDAVPLTNREKGSIDLQGFTNARTAIVEIGSRHPLRLEQAKEIEVHFGAPGTILEMLEVGDLAQVEYYKQYYLLPSHLINGKFNN